MASLAAASRWRWGGALPADPLLEPVSEPGWSLAVASSAGWPAQEEALKRVWAQVASRLDLGWEVTPPPGGL